MTLKQMQKRAHDTAKAKGWWDGKRYDGTEPGNGAVNPELVDVPTSLCLIHSEVSEALESHRNGEPLLHYDGAKPEGVAAELADVIIRIGDLCGALDIDIESAVLAKMSYNETRSHRHGGKKC